MINYLINLPFKWYIPKKINRIQHVHSKYFIHRDVKPENFCFGNGDFTQIYLIDFGMAKRYINAHTGQHIEYRENKHIVGTPRYASINSHRGIELSRRDDLESLGYTLIYLITGTLPWKGVGPNSNIKQIKQNVSTRQLCEGLPLSYIKYFKNTLHLEFKEEPNYPYLSNLLSNQHNFSDIDPREIDERSIHNTESEDLRSSNKSIVVTLENENQGNHKNDSIKRLCYDERSIPNEHAGIVAPAESTFIQSNALYICGKK